MGIHYALFEFCISYSRLISGIGSAWQYLSINGIVIYNLADGLDFSTVAPERYIYLTVIRVCSECRNNRDIVNVGRSR